ncbi:MAG: apolipoprotein N-acyltransferase [Betaproteobacteria bacterium]|nr:apolipoprotein N-acyltransferase [Betaproteobacteria bacterium]
MRYAAAFLAGMAAVTAFSPLDLLPVGLLALAALVHLWSTSSNPRQGFLVGWWFGAGLFGAGVSWVYVSLHQFGGMPAPVAAFSTAAFCAFLALFPAAAGWLQALVPAAPAVRATLVIPAVWTMTEWVRGSVLTGFPWLAFGSAVPGWSLAGFAPLAGMYGCSLVVLAVAGLIWCAARRHAVAASLAVALALAAGGEALRHVQWTGPAGTLQVALLQGAIPQEMKFAPERYALTMDKYTEMVEQQADAKLIVMPETAVPRFLDRVEPARLSRLAAAARRNGGDLLLGIPVRTSSEAYFNSVVTLGISPTQRYDKSHLVPFGEFVPPGFGWIMRLMSIPLSDFTRGSDRPRPLEVAGTRVAISVCYENAYGEELARQLPEATLLVNVSNVAWFGDSLAPAQHLQIARMRAIETGRTHLTSTNTGITAVIGRDGQVIIKLLQFLPGRIAGAVQLYSGATPYVRIGDLGALALALAMIGVSAFLARAGRGR